MPNATAAQSVASSAPTALRAYYFAAFGAFGLYLPYFPAWLEAQGFTGAAMSALTMLVPLLSLASPPLVGLLSDRLGLRGRMMMAAAALTALGLTLLAVFALALQPLPFPVAFGCMLLFASFRAPTVGLADVLAMERARNYGRMRLFGSMGFLTMALLGGSVIDFDHPYQLPALVAGALWSVVLLSRFLPQTSGLPPRPPLKDAMALLGQSGFRRLWLTMVVTLFSISAYDLCSSLRLRNLGGDSQYIGYFWSIATGTEILLMFWAAPFIKRFGPGKLLTLACLVGTGRWLLLSQLESLAWILVLQPLHAVSFGLMWLASIAALQREVGPKAMATAHGMFSSAIAVGATCGIWVWGVTYERFGASTVFLAAACTYLLAAGLASRLIRW